jgi:hypothetical protein
MNPSNSCEPELLNLIVGYNPHSSCAGLTPMEYLAFGE